jgi:uncharacterized membrane protein
MIDFILYHTPVFYLVQSIWRDEAFSYFMAKPNLFQVITNTAKDFNPPFYYIMLHFWIMLVGKDDVLLRLLSFIPHLFCVYLTYKIALHAFSASKRFSIFAAFFTLFNPMLLYYAFEMRMYSFYALFTFISLYCFQQKRWKPYLISSVLGLYTHSFFPLVILSYLIYAVIFEKADRKTVFRLLKPVLFFLPWLPIVTLQFLRSGNSWIFPVDLQLIFSSLGNLFTNYEGTPGDWWNHTALLSAFILLITIGFSHRAARKKMILFTVPIFFPLFLILGYSLFRRPIYVNRYLIFVSVFEIISILFGIYSIKNKTARSVVSVILIVFIICVNIIISPYHKKTDFKNAFKEITQYSKYNDYVYSRTPIGFLESIFYFSNENNVYIYNPNNITIPNYIGTTVVFPNSSKQTFPPPPSRVFLISDNADYELIINQ